MQHPSPSLPCLTHPSPAAIPLASGSLLAAPPPPARSLRAPTASARTGPAAGLSVEDPSVEARRAVGVLLGAGANGVTAAENGAEGLLERVERDIEGLLDAYERAFEEGGAGIDISQSLASLTSLLSLLSRSSLGGFVPSASPSSSTSSAAPIPPRTLEQSDVDAASARVQELFREVQRRREAGEVARVGLTG
ncbi:hypothetical protein JCM10213v2_008831 [Rhodosporidiobolus nylandii]